MSFHHEFILFISFYFFFRIRKQCICSSNNNCYCCNARCSSFRFKDNYYCLAIISIVCYTLYVLNVCAVLFIAFDFDAFFKLYASVSCSLLYISLDCLLFGLNFCAIRFSHLNFVSLCTRFTFTRVFFVTQKKFHRKVPHWHFYEKKFQHFFFDNQWEII